MATFFQEFNEAEPTFNQRRKSLTFYDTKFDLSSLARNTNASVTQEVIVKADTVYMSQPLDITYSLIIRARVASIGKIFKRRQKFFREIEFHEFFPSISSAVK